MADTLANIILTENAWVDLYATTSIAIGTKLRIQNVGSSNVKLHTGATTPDADAGYVIMQPLENYMNYTGESGAWAMSVTSKGQINVSEAG